MAKQRLDQLVFNRGMVQSRSQAESWIRLGKVLVNGQTVSKPGTLVAESAEIILTASEQYVSRAGLKLASVAEILDLHFAHHIMLDVGSSTGGFTDYALQHGAVKVIAVELGTDQLHMSLRGNPHIELYEQTDIRQVFLKSQTAHSQRRIEITKTTASQGNSSDSQPTQSAVFIDQPDIVVIDVSFISLRQILPHVASLCGSHTVVAAMVKPQFEAVESNLKHKGVIKNDRMRREILKDFENWVTRYFVVLDKADSSVAGAKGNRERFYKLRLPK